MRISVPGISLQFAALATVVVLLGAQSPSVSAETAASASPAARTVQDYPQFRHLFPFGMYVAAERFCDAWSPTNLSPTHIGRPVVETYKRDLEDMAHHYINVIAVENTSAIPIPVLRQLIREGRHVGILTWASENGLPKDEELEKWTKERQGALKDEPGLLAWSPYDEPYPEQMDRWLKLKAAFEKADPNHPVIAVTCGGPKGFEKYDIVQAYDYYPVYIKNPNPWDIWPMVQRYVNEGYGRPIWFAQQAFQGEGRRLPTIAESRMMTYIALAAGAKGIFYFIYDHISDPTNNPHPLWTDAATMGRRLTAIGPEVLDTSPDLKSTWVSLTAEPNNDSHRPKDWPPVKMSVLKSPSGPAFLVLFNTSVEEKVKLRLSVTEAAASKRLYDLYAVTDNNQDPEARKEMDLTLDPGDGRILLLADAKDSAATIQNVRRNRFEQEKRLLALDRETAERWTLPLGRINQLSNEADRLSSAGDYAGAVTFEQNARNELSRVESSNHSFRSSRVALDGARYRIADVRSLLSVLERKDSSAAHSMKGRYLGLASRYLELEALFSTGSELLADRASGLQKDADQMAEEVNKAIKG